MNDERWDSVDAYTTGLLQPSDPILEAAISDSAALPNIAVAPAQGQFLHLLARAVNARRILEIGTSADTAPSGSGERFPTTGA